MSEADGRDGEGERIARRIARAGVASRRAAEAMIAEGRVSVNGRVIDSPALNVTPRDKILVDGQPLAAPEPRRLWRYYKPVGLVTSERDEKGRETVFSRLPAEMPRVVSVGRLDLNSEGLLLLTNDGALKRRLELPTTGWLRKYRVRAHGAADDAVLEPLRRGLTVDGERFQPMTVTFDRTQGSNVWLTVSLREGRNREVRRALEAVGLAVNRLIRVSYGPFQLGELEPGQVEEVRSKVLREQLGLDAESSGEDGRERRGGPRPAAQGTAANGTGAKKPAGQTRGPRSGAGKAAAATTGGGKAGAARERGADPKGAAPAGQPRAPQSAGKASRSPKTAGAAEAGAGRGGYSQKPQVGAGATTASARRRTPKPLTPTPRRPK